MRRADPRPSSFARVAFVALGLAGGLASGLAGACIATSPDGLSRVTDDDAGSDGLDLDGGYGDALTDLGEVDPHAVVGVDPPHGAFAGGQRVLIHGNGFGPDVRVWFDGDEVDPATVVAIDPTRVQVAAPPHSPATVDISAQNGTDESTRRTLLGGYTYDAFYLVPDSGPVAGGTEAVIHGFDTEWSTSTTALIDQTPCTSLTVESPTELRCGIPQGSPGAKPVRVEDAGETVSVLDAYTYEDSANGFKGGLSGAPLDGALKVLVYDNFTGDAIGGAHVIVGSDLDTALVSQTDGTGVALVDDASLTGAVTVTVTADCHSPITFVDVPVDTVTAYLDLVLTPGCFGDGDPPSVGGTPANYGSVSGEIVFGSAQEFQKGPWTVPAPVSPNEARRAYVFEAAPDPTYSFSLPSPGAAITPESPGDVGYGFFYTSGPGNRTLYALAGIEDRSVNPPRFTAYLFGVVRGVPVVPGATTDEVYIHMTSTLDLALTMDISPPDPGPSGPDRVRATTAVRLGSEGYAILPAAQAAPLLPLSGPVTFVGVPLLSGELLGATYSSSARVGTGAKLDEPLSVVGQLTSTTTSQVVEVDAFVPIPALVSPSVGSAWDDAHLETSFAGSGGNPTGLPVDLTVYDVSGAGGLMHWVIAVPGGGQAIEIPDIRAFPTESLPPGPLHISVYGAHIDDFDYGELRYRNLRPQGMTAYSFDSFDVHH